MTASKRLQKPNLTSQNFGGHGFVGTNATQDQGLRGVGFAGFLGGGGGFPLDKVKLKDKCKFHLKNDLKNELFNDSQELPRHQAAAAATNEPRAAAFLQNGDFDEVLSEVVLTPQTALSLQEFIACINALQRAFLTAKVQKSTNLEEILALNDRLLLFKG